MTGPIKPSDIDGARQRAIPEPVFEAFNELIAEHWNGHEARIGIDEAIVRVLAKLHATEEHKDDAREAVFRLRWLDVEPAYRKAGWRVEFDKPGYCETYEANWKFRKAGK